MSDTENDSKNGKSNLEVLVVKESQDKICCCRPFNPVLPDVDAGCCLLVVSPVRTGKSNLISNLLLNPAFYRDCFDIVYIFSNTIDNDVTSRFLKKQFPETIYNEYNDKVLYDILNYQKSFPKKDQPKICLIFDDFVGSIKQNSIFFKVSSRYRHYNVKLLLYASQLFKAVPPLVRQNVTDFIMGAPNPSTAEVRKISEEYGQLFEGDKKFRALYRQCAPERYDFAYFRLQHNPSEAWSNFNKRVYIGSDTNEAASDEED
tara:strand:- start:575 stop:1354 length:780 start_codon:yes stop_codon:yes gene_type:complete